MKRRNFGEIIKICLLARLNLMFQVRVTKPRLRLIMEPEYRLESTVIRYHCLPDYRDTVVGDTLPCVAESSNNSDRFAVANI